ncbi:MAG: DUF427 domain-containing protein [Planctomycetota bacterium]
MTKATWNGVTIAESSQTVVVEGNHYFPSDSIVAEHLKDSSKTSVCPWKGTARYYDIVVGGEVNAGAAWCYPDCKPEAKNIEGYFAFWKGVSVS